VTPGSALVARDAGDPVTAAWLLANGYAIAGSSYSQNGWALQQAFHDQIALLGHFQDEHGKPARTIAWGHSLGGIITAGLIQLNPERFAGAIPMCGVVAGGVGVWNQGLDAEFVFKTLAPEAAASALQLVNITNTGFGTGSNFQLAEFVAAQEQATPQGRARLALVAAVADTPGWFDTASAEPASGDFAGRELNQYKWDSQVTFPFSFALRAELEARAGGNPSWNTGVDYRNELNRSINKDEVAALYAQAGLDLNADLDKLADAPRISASASAVSYLTKYIVFNGQLESPVLTMHTIGDGLVLPQDEQAYSNVVRSQDNSDLLRTTFVHRAGHCAFTPAETVTAFNTLIHRLNTGSWGVTTQPSPMNSVRRRNHRRPVVRPVPSISLLAAVRCAQPRGEWGRRRLTPEARRWARRQVGRRVDRPLVDAQLEVQVGAGRVPARALEPDRLALRHPVSQLDECRRKVAVKGVQTT
jgi:pimeloyl-ACP methyl ester carboxylesterase